MKTASSTKTLAINKIYLATEGEGIHLGTPEVIVRLQGCGVGCRHCDTPAALKIGLPNATAAEVMAQVAQYPLVHKRMSLTGGDPLAWAQRAGLLQLIRLAHQAGYFINLEAHGLTPLAEAREVYDEVDFISADFKTPSGGPAGKLELLQALQQNYASKLQIKSVILDQADFRYVLKAYQDAQPWPKQVSWVLTPAFNLGESLPVQRIEQIYTWNYQAGGMFKVIVQQHKVVFGPQREDV